MASNVSIVNFALRRLGARTITAFADDSVEAALASETYEQIRDELLREHLWNFATRRASLAASTEEPEWGYVRQFLIPADFLRLVGVDGSSCDAVKMESHATDGRVLLTDLAAPLRIIYIAKVEDPELYDPSFRRALSLRCAMEWAQKLTGTTSIVEQLAAEYDQALRMARGVDGQEDTTEALRPTFWIDARQ